MIIINDKQKEICSSSYIFQEDSYKSIIKSYDIIYVDFIKDEGRLLSEIIIIVVSDFQYNIGNTLLYISHYRRLEFARLL